jgi:U3 small nucleolar RNA-associated protein 11
MSASLRNAIKRTTHKERSQPQERQKLGLLEKRKDYQLRAKDFHRKEDQIKVLKRKASERNPDEYYFAMERAKTKEGVHEARTSEQNKFTEDELKVMKTQDLRYVTMKAQQELNKVKKMKETLHCLGAGSDERTHTIFVDDYEDVKNFKAAKYFDTPKELIGRAFNRPRTEQLEDADALVGVGANEIDFDEEELMKQQERRLKKVAKLNRGAYKMLNEREQRAEQLKSMTLKMAMEKEISYSKGVKKKITRKNKDGTTESHFVWKQIRKK